MVFWAGILVGGLFAWLAIKLGFYETWALLFNVVVSVYVSVFLTPIIMNVVPAASDTAYGSALTLSAVAIGTFLILHGITYTLFTAQYSLSFPKIFDTVGSGFLGFLGGFLIWSFAALIISATPISENAFARDIGFGSKIEQTNVPYIAWWCDLIGKAVATRDGTRAARQTISELLKRAKEKSPHKPADQPDADAPVTPTGPQAD